MGLVAAWRVGPRIGRFGDGAEADPPGPTNIPLVALGIMVVIPALTFFALVAGYVVPGTGFLGISMTSTGFGLLLENLFAAIVAGGLMGAYLSYRTRNPYWAIAGPFAGYVSSGTLFDVGRPWYIFLIALGAPLVSMLVVTALERLRIDENKLVPLILGPAVYGGIIGGFTEWGERTGGFVGITEGEFAFQNAEITPWGQLVGVAVGVGIGAGVALIVCLIVERFTSLRVAESVEREGMDARYWPPPRPVAIAANGDANAAGGDALRPLTTEPAG
jgi:ammonia channel protein AmtB